MLKNVASKKNLALDRSNKAVSDLFVKNATKTVLFGAAILINTQSDCCLQTIGFLRPFLKGINDIFKLLVTYFTYVGGTTFFHPTV